MTRILIKTLTVLRFLPLPWLRALGALMGLMVWSFYRRRRHIVLINLQLCFPAWSQAQHRRHSRAVFVFFMQSWLDRFWLWHSSKRLIQQRLKWVVIGSEVPGDFSTSVLAEDEPVVIFAPHFMGLDAGWTALNRLTTRRYATIYAAQNNQALDAWVKAGRSLSMCDEPPLLINHHAGVRPIVQALRKNAALYLLPDMNYEPQDSLYTPSSA